jgi:hypothetical protein
MVAAAKHVERLPSQPLLVAGCGRRKYLPGECEMARLHDVLDGNRKVCTREKLRTAGYMVATRPTKRKTPLPFR